MVVFFTQAVYHTRFVHVLNNDQLCILSDEMYKDQELQIAMFKEMLYLKKMERKHTYMLSF